MSTTYTYNFKDDFDKYGAPLLSLNSKNKEALFLVDTGADANIIFNNSIKNIKHRVNETYETTFNSAHNAIAKQVKDVYAYLSTPYNTFNLHAMVPTDNHFSTITDYYKNNYNITLSGILGTEFLIDYKVVIDYGTMHLYMTD